MKKIIMLAFALTAVLTGMSKDKFGTTTALWAKPTTANFIEAKKCGLDYVEVALNQCYRGVPKGEVIARMKQMKAQLDSAGMKVWSVHLPFSKTMDISVPNANKRKANVEFMAEIITACEMYGARYYVLHSSSEPIYDSLREQRIAYAVESIKILKPYADKVGAVLCIEDLPRTCIGNTPEELVYIVDRIPGVKICFDTGHYEKGTIDHFISVVGDRVATIHAYDFAETTDAHWLPTQGNINWGKLVRDLRKNGYKGTFMFEATKDRHNNEGPLTPAQVAESFAKIQILIKQK